MTKNSLIHDIDKRYFGTYKPSDTEQALKITEKLAWDRIDRILHLDPKDRTFGNTVLALTRSTDEFQAVVGIVSHLESVHGKPWSKACILATSAASRLISEIGLHEGLYKALKEVDSKFKIRDLSHAQNKLLTDLVRDYKHGGVDLPPKQKQRLKQIDEELSNLTTKFGQNSVKANDKAGVHLINRLDLEGLSSDIVDSAQVAAKKKGLKGYWLQYSEPNFYAVMSQCAVRSTRQAMHKAVKTTGMNINQPLAQKILTLRYEEAKLLGYKNYSDYRLKSRMAKNGKTARAFINGLIKTYLPTIKKEHLELEKFARRYENDPTLKLNTSDVDGGVNWFYAQKLLNEITSVDEDSVKDYFPISKVMSGMFEILSTLYGVRFAKNSSEKTWHKEVEVYDVYDEANRRIATVWCDWFARENKLGGAWMNAFYCAERADDVVNKPHLGYVVANLSPPTKTRPSLLTLREVETIWHEFGHFMHFALGKAELIEQSMLDIEWDFVEAPSQIFENWVWQPEVLAKITEHYKTKKQIPLEIVEKLKFIRHFRTASKSAGQFILAKTDLDLHMDYAKDPSKADPIAVSHKNKLTIKGIKAEKWDKGVMSFTHIFASDYASAYYSYKWAEAIEADFFEKFKKGGVLNAKLGREYRDKVLARGAEVPATKLVKDFLGRSSNIKAMLRRDGIKP